MNSFNITNQCRFAFFTALSLCIICTIPFLNAQEIVKTKEVIVDGVGVSPETAKKNAFRNAVSKVVGSFIENDILIKNDKIIEDKLLEYSGGFVETFEIISESKDKDGLFKVKLKAKIAQQTVVEKLRSMKIDVKSVSGSNLKAQFETQETMKKEGGKLINSIMEEYPKLWQAKQMGEPKIANGKLALQIEVSVDREKYLAWAEKLCKVLEKSADCTTSRSYKKSGPVASYDSYNYRLPGGNCSIFSVDPYYFKVNPDYLKFNKANEGGIVFSVVRDFAPQGNCDLQSYLFYKSNPMFEVIGINEKPDQFNRNHFYNKNYLRNFLPNRLEIKIQDVMGANIFKETIKGTGKIFGEGLWEYPNGFAMVGNLFPVTPFAQIGGHGFTRDSGNVRYSTSCILKTDLPIEGIDVGKISKITTGFSIEK